MNRFDCGPAESIVRQHAAAAAHKAGKSVEFFMTQLTGRDPIPARYMRGDFFEYVPQFKLVVQGNHKPGLRSVDEAIRRRFNLVPFTTLSDRTLALSTLQMSRARSYT